MYPRATAPFSTGLLILAACLLGCSSKSLPEPPSAVECAASWREIEIPDELRWLPDGRYAVWVDGRLFVLSNNAFGFGVTPNLVYEPPDRFTRMSTDGAPHEWLGAAVTAAGDVFATTRREGQGKTFTFRYDTDADAWSGLPEQGSGEIQAPVLLSFGEELFVARAHVDVEPLAIHYLTISSPWEGWHETPAGPEFVTDMSASIGNGALLWGGSKYEGDVFGYVGSGARYDATSDSWHSTAEGGAPTPRENGTLVWTGTEAIVWGGFGEEAPELGTGARYYPDQDAWQPVTPDGAPEARGGHSAVAVGRKMIVWGGQVAGAYATTGAIYDAGADSWAPLPTHCGPDRSIDSALVWVDDGLIVWGGVPNDCNSSPFSVECEEYRERAWFLPREVALGEVAGDSGGCTCPQPIGGDER